MPQNRVSVTIVHVTLNTMNNVELHQMPLSGVHKSHYALIAHAYAIQDLRG